MQGQDRGEAHGGDAGHGAEDGDRLADPESHKAGMAPETGEPSSQRFQLNAGHGPTLTAVLGGRRGRPRPAAMLSGPPVPVRRWRRTRKSKSVAVLDRRAAVDPRCEILWPLASAAWCPPETSRW